MPPPIPLFQQKGPTIMQCNRTLLSIALVCAVAGWAVTGCDQSTGTDTPNDMSSRTQVVNLNDPYGGYNTANEKPAFGDPFLSGNYGLDAGAALADSDSLSESHMRVHRFLMVTWGNLRADSTIDFSTDWSGSLCVENGVIRPVRTIRFEPADHLVPPSAPSCVQWVSHTQPDFDGILVALHRLPCDSLVTASALTDSLCGTPLSVTFTTGPLTVTFSQSELTNLHKVIQVDDAGNAVAFNTIVLMPGACRHGFLAGQWKHVDGRRYDGIFRGEWVSENGLHQGFLHGVYGQNRLGDHVFFGKWITETGEFHGLLKGRYGALPPTHAGSANGWFDGVWFSRQLMVEGGMAGVWGTSDADGEGFFRGAWVTHCK